ncbi:Crp/Fnr family transcriptional regulator [Actinomadura bangladeshensis]|uniref:Crp/Fnr family transcriptional regulator n=1 Tax=Actinomadura bangladeshensis TaxID=453573 RepID=A0A4R4NNV9_9ACTN|nr:Crp/Fnr family transcriptional regulator [Actinomadura bangladeshensis]TDC09397.1 Crp/Fnr family transcriptional regulator [Actinomadura bangladeshensis]
MSGETPGWWIGFWDYLEEDERQALLLLGRKRTFDADSVLLHEDEPSSHVLILLQGWVKIACNDSEGREVILAIRGPGDILGEMEVMLADPRRSAMVKTLMNRLQALVVPATAFTRFLDDHPNAWRALYLVLAYRLREANRNAREFGRIGVRQALARLLLDLATRHGERSTDGLITVRLLSQDEISACIWASRDAVAHELVQLRNRNVLRTGRRSFTIIDMREIRRIAQAGDF